MGDLPGVMNRALMPAPIQEQDQLAGTGHVHRLATSESSRVFGSAVVETVDQEQRVLMNAGHAQTGTCRIDPETRRFSMNPRVRPDVLWADTGTGNYSDSTRSR